MSAQAHLTSGGVANPSDIQGFEEFSHDAILENGTSFPASSKECVEFKSLASSTSCGVGGEANGTLANPPPRLAINLLPSGLLAENPTTMGICLWT